MKTVSEEVSQIAAAPVGANSQNGASVEGSHESEPMRRVGTGDLVRPLTSIDLWLGVCMADEGNSVQLHKTKEEQEDANYLISRGLIEYDRGRRWVKLTAKGTAVRNRTSA